MSSALLLALLAQVEIPVLLDVPLASYSRNSALYSSASIGHGDLGTCPRYNAPHSALQYTMDAGWYLCGDNGWERFGSGACIPASGYPGSCTASSYVGTTPDYYLQTIDAGILLPDGGGLGNTRIGAFNCPGVVNGVPCVANPRGIVEIYGSQPPGQSFTTLCSVELYNAVEGGSAAGCLVGVGDGFTSNKVFRVMAGGNVYQQGNLYFENGGRLIRQTSANQYLEISGNAAATGVALYVGNQTAMSGAGQVQQWLNSSLQVAAVHHDGALTSESTRTAGCDTLASGTKTVTVVSSATCVAGNRSSTANPVTWSISGTTLTITDTSSSSTDVVCWVCL
ncbi:MAG: hypothetical protein E6Q97_01350 [Desulfurellales bacterium]|nr:MAG: hypothetical protein E6Q97_01350 [Desulfurellales bacterium]